MDRIKHKNRIHERVGSSRTGTREEEFIIDKR